MTSRARTDLLLGVDVGTTLLKAGLYTRDGLCLGLGQAPQGVTTPRPGWTEQDPAQWWEGLCTAVRAALARAGRAGDRVAAVGLSTQGGTLALFDAQGGALRPALVWSDARQTAEEVEAAACEEHFAVTGRLDLDMTAAALTWLRAREPDLLARARRIGYVPDYLTFRLTGDWVSDPTNLSISNLLDLAARDVPAGVLKRLGLPRDRFARTLPAGEVAGHLTGEAALALGLPAGLPVATPAHDQYAAAVGAGCTHAGDLLLSAGTAWVLLLTTDRPLLDRESCFIAGPHVARGRWGLLGAISTGSSTLDSLLALTCDHRDFARIDAAAEAVPPGSAGLLVVPHLSGRTLPTRGPNARGALLGWSLGHQREHLWRAAMEGLAFETRAACDYLAARGAAIRELRLVGGAARSPLWPRIIASVLSDSVLTQPDADLAVRGAACLAARALGEDDLPEAAAWQEHAPCADWRAAYDEAYGRYGEAIRRLETS